MNAKDYVQYLFPKTLAYKLAMKGLVKPANPITLTFSVTAACQSRCKTCHIGDLWLENPEMSNADLSLEEIEKIFKSLGPVYFLNISGGEPFLRKDLPQIIELACKYLTPKIIHTPTNAILPKRIEKMTIEILQIIKAYDPNVPFTVKPSIDGVGDKHDEVRGYKGNFKRLEETIVRLKAVQQIYPNFHLELGTVISNFNIDHLEEIEDYVHSLGVESYRNEVAEQREEFYNVGEPITPTGEKYENLMKSFKQKVKDNLKSKRRLARITESFRLVYYDLVSAILKEKRQVIPCYGGISNVHLNYNGELWPCCVLGYDKPMGNIRNLDYDFQRIFHSEQANEVRQYIKDEKCHCPLANQSYSNILCDFPSLFKVIKGILLG